MEPTKRFVLDISRSCNIKCKFCYYLHTYPDWKKYDWSLDKAKIVINQGIDRGNNYMDITGGEPTIYKYICEVVEYASTKNIKTCIITNGIVSKAKTLELLVSGADDFLISRHGLENTHNYITNYKKAYEKQEYFISWLKEFQKSFRFNCVINYFNQKEIYDIALELSKHNPRIINFINMNPHHEWQEKILDTKEVVADLDIVEPLLNQTIEYLESKKIGVNIRYYPMCRIAEEYRKYICNDLHVVFDPYEWDYNILPKNINSFSQWGVRTSNNIELQESPCTRTDCSLKITCGGINKAFNRATEGRYLKPVSLNQESIDDFYFYRKDNKKVFV